jgi:hypothetical protein
VILPPQLVSSISKKRSRPGRLRPWIVGVAVASAVLVGGLLGLWLNELWQNKLGQAPRADAGSAGPAKPGVAVSPGRQDLTSFRAADQAFAVELDRAEQQTLQLEAEAFDAPAGTSVSQELAELADRVRLLELELAPRRTGFQPVPVHTQDSQPIEDNHHPSPNQPAAGLEIRPANR